MPDQDIFDHSFPKGWTNPARKINQGVDPEIAAQATARTRRKYLKELSGLPELKTVYELLPISYSPLDSEIILRVFDQIENYERSSSNRDIADILGKTGRQCCIEIAAKRSDTVKMDIADVTFPLSGIRKAILSKFSRLLASW